MVMKNGNTNFLGITPGHRACARAGEAGPGYRAMTTKAMFGGPSIPVIPAKAGIQKPRHKLVALESGLRRTDARRRTYARPRNLR
jgi:hypothetical protein